MPVANPYHPSTSSQIANNLPSLKQTGKVVPIPIPPQYLPQSSRPIPTGTPATAIPSLSQSGETFNISVQEDYEQKTTADEAQNAMKELLGGVIGSIDLSSINMEDAKVEGFSDDIRLMPHQIQGRAWMKERETGKKAGGILADVSPSIVARGASDYC